MLGTEEEVVLLHTGHGLKDIAAAGRAAAENPLTEVGTDSRAVESILGILGKEIG